ncbi:MAG TPA: DUF4203 domain-containing protein [Vicinamibacterales bacterium]|nr:DUF4203 domain-containing protein [Vicinamibacterales bacterium]
MLPASYATPVAAVLVAGGLLACFAGYRLFRVVLGVYGFILGAAVTTSMLGEAGMWALVLAAVVGGLVGATLMIAAYFVGVGLVGAGLAVLGLNLFWRLVGGDPPTVVLVIVAVLGALGALSVARWVVIFGTALAGSWTALVGGLALGGDTDALRAASAGDVWVIYPLGPGAEGDWWMPALWFVLTCFGVLVQLKTTGKTGKRKKRPRAAE